MSLADVLGAIAVICSLAAAGHALLSKRDSKSALGWIAFCLFMPFVGPVIYLIFGINRTSAKAKEFFPTDQNKKAGHQGTYDLNQDIPFAAIGKSVTGGDIRPCSKFEVLENGEALYPKMLAAITNARHRVFLSTYIFQNDSTGNQFVEALAAAQNRGVDVRIIVDGMGVILYRPRIGNKLKRAKLNFRYFDPARLIPPSLHINLRNHRKLLVVDQHIGFTGGQNIGDRHLVTLPDNPKTTRDLHFSFQGEIVTDLENAFLKDWRSCDKKAGEIRQLEMQPPIADMVAWTRVILDGPNENLDKLNELLVGVFSLAKQRIWIMTPYFLPGFDLIGALVGAKHRGVDVKIILPERTNVHLTHWATQHSLQHIEARGLAVFLQPAPFVHTKAIIIDDSYSLVGSANLDPRSLRLNFELGVEVFSDTFNQKLANYFKLKLEKSHKLDQVTLLNQPLSIRIRNAIAWLFTPYL